MRAQYLPEYSAFDGAESSLSALSGLGRSTDPGDVWGCDFDPNDQPHMSRR